MVPGAHVQTRVRRGSTRTPTRARCCTSRSSTPLGRYAGYSLPQGLGDHGNIGVASPQPGKWTALFFTEWDGDAAGAAAPPAPCRGTPASGSSVGRQRQPRRRSSLRGDARTSPCTLPNPSNPGDTAYSLVLSNNMTLPVTLRTQIDVNAHSGGTFSGRPHRRQRPRRCRAAQSNICPVHRAAGKNDLDASLAMDSNLPDAAPLARRPVRGLLVDPNGQIAAYDTNYTQDSSGFASRRTCRCTRPSPSPASGSCSSTGCTPSMGVAGRRSRSPAPCSSTRSPPPQRSLTPRARGLRDGAGRPSWITVNNTGVAPLLALDGRTAAE